MKKQLHHRTAIAGAALAFCFFGDAYAALFDSTSLDGHYIADVVKANSNTYLLTTVRSNSENYMTDPDGTRKYKSDAYLIKVDSSKNLTKTLLTNIYASSPNNGFDGGALLVSGGSVYAFLNSFVEPSSYAQKGVQYTISEQNMALLGTPRTIFSYANWGWFPVVTSPNSVMHFSFSGYRRINDSVDMGYVDPQIMVDEALQNRVSHAGGLFTVDEFKEINGTFRPTLVQRLMPTSSDSSTNLVDLILSNNRAALNYSTNTLTVPTLDIPQAGSSPLTFSSTWKATNAAAPNAVFYLADAQQIANVSSPTATFDPVTFTVSMPNVITSGSNNGTDGLAAQKYQVIVEGSILGLVRMGATTQQGCPAQTLSWTVNGQTCSVSGIVGSNGMNVLGSSDGRGSATFSCTNGQWGAPQSATCGAPTLTCSYPQVAQNGQCVTPVTAVSCPTQTLPWGGNCSASVSAASSGQNTVLSNQSGNGYTGNASFTCSSNGSWSISGTTCNPPVVTTTTCQAQTLPWGGNCSASVPAMSSGQSTNNLPNQLSNGYTGNASFTCSSNGSWSTVSNGCSAPAVNPPVVCSPKLGNC